MAESSNFQHLWVKFALFCYNNLDRPSTSAKGQAPHLEEITHVLARSLAVLHRSAADRCSAYDLSDDRQGDRSEDERFGAAAPWSDGLFRYCCIGLTGDGSKRKDRDACIRASWHPGHLRHVAELHSARGRPFFLGSRCQV